MRLLDIQGLVVVRPGAGTFIIDDSIEAIVQAFSSLLSDDTNHATLIVTLDFKAQDRRGTR